jgi:hypothetical protein
MHLAVLLVALLAACAKSPPPSSARPDDTREVLKTGFHSIRTGMGTAEVEQRLGQPADKKLAVCVPNTIEYWVYQADGENLVSFVHFVDGKVVEVVEENRRLAFAEAKGCVG